jgi:hypothetical protein
MGFYGEKQTRLAVRIIIIIVKTRVASHNNLLGSFPDATWALGYGSDYPSLD